ncbi:MAG: hypothetical protein Fur0034_20510 [Desulfuromonadia bacterium]
MDITRVAIVSCVIAWIFPSMVLAGELLHVVTAGSGLQGKVEIKADEPMTYLVSKKGETSWQIDIAKMSPGNLPHHIPLSLPAATGITIEKRSMGKIDATRLLLTVRPNVAITVTPSADRRLLTISFASGGVSPSANDSLLDDLDDDRGKKKSDPPPAIDDLDAPVVPPAVPVAEAATPPAGGDLAGEGGGEKPRSGKGDDAAPQAPPTQPHPSSGLDEELTAMETKGATPVTHPSPIPPSMETMPVEPKPAAPSVAAEPPAIDPGALTPEELETPPPGLGKKPTAEVSPEPEHPRSVSGGESRVVLSVSGSTIEISAPSLSSHRAFTLFQPTRVVIDLFGVSIDLSRPLSPDTLPPSVKGVRSSRYPDKTRIVFDMKGDDLPEYVVARESGILRITFR